MEQKSQMLYLQAKSIQQMQLIFKTYGRTLNRFTAKLTMIKRLNWQGICNLFIN